MTSLRPIISRSTLPMAHALPVMAWVQIEEITEESVIPDKKLSISRGGIFPLGEYRDIWIFKKIEAILKRYKADADHADQRHSQRCIESSAVWRRCAGGGSLGEISGYRVEHQSSRASSASWKSNATKVRRLYANGWRTLPS